MLAAMQRAWVLVFGACVLLRACGSDGRIDLGSTSTGGAATSDAGTGGVAGSAGTGTCGSSAQCSGEKAFCELSSGQCVKCLVAGHCKEPGKACDPVEFECEDACGGDAECTSADKPFCDPTRSICIECRQDAHCTSGDDNLCLTTKGKCVECRGDADCGNAEKPFCPLNRNECSECLVDGHCPSGQECDPKEYKCRA